MYFVIRADNSNCDWKEKIQDAHRKRREHKYEMHILTSNLNIGK